MVELLLWNGLVIKYVRFDFKYFLGILYFVVYVLLLVKISIFWIEYQFFRSLFYEIELLGFLFKKFMFDINFDGLFLNISLKFFIKNWNVYVFDIEVMDCDFSKLVLIGRIYVSWFNEKVYSFLSNGIIQFVLKLNYLKFKGIKDKVQLYFWFDFKCLYRIIVYYDFY